MTRHVGSRGRIGLCLDDRPLRFALGLTLAAVLGAALVLLYQSTHGVQMVFLDSLTYLSVARNLLQGDGFVRWSGQPFDAAWPPGYPLLLALASLGRFDPVAVAGPFNAALHGVTIFAAGCWLRQRIASRFLVGWGCLVLAGAAPLLKMTAAMMSDYAFALCVTLSLSQLDLFLARGRGRHLAAAAAGTGVAALTRYAGLPLIAASLALLAWQPGISLRIKAVRAGAFTLLSLAPIGAWLYRNYRLTGVFTSSEGTPALGLTWSRAPPRCSGSGANGSCSPL